jgi:hypothetical protein
MEAQSPKGKKEEEAKAESDNTHKTKMSKKSQKSTRSIRSDKSDRTEHPRERFQMDKSVKKYQREKKIEDLERSFEYKTDEESIYKSFTHDPKELPLSVTKKFALNTESKENKKIIKDMLKRFSEKTQTYEYMVKFNMTVEKTDESTISLQGNTPGHLIDQKERRRYVRKELREFKKQDMFNHP